MQVMSRADGTLKNLQLQEFGLPIGKIQWGLHLPLTYIFLNLDDKALNMFSYLGLLWHWRLQDHLNARSSLPFPTLGCGVLTEHTTWVQVSASVICATQRLGPSWLPAPLSLESQSTSYGSVFSQEPKTRQFSVKRGHINFHRTQELRCLNPNKQFLSLILKCQCTYRPACI